MEHLSKAKTQDVGPDNHPSDTSSSKHDIWLQVLPQENQIKGLIKMSDKDFEEYLKGVREDLREDLTKFRKSLVEEAKGKGQFITDRSVSASPQQSMVEDPDWLLSRSSTLRQESTVIRNIGTSSDTAAFHGDAITEEPAAFPNPELRVTRSELEERAKMYNKIIDDIFSKREINSIFGENAQKNLDKMQKMLEGNNILVENIMSLSGEYGMLDNDEFEISITGAKLLKNIKTGEVKTGEVKTDEKIGEQANEIDEEAEKAEDVALSRLRKRHRESTFEEEIKAISEDEVAFRALVRQTVKILEKALKISENEIEYFKSTVESIYREPHKYRDTAEILYQYYEEYKANIRSRGRMYKSMRKAGKRVWRTCFDRSKPTILQLKKSIAIQLHQEPRRLGHLERKHGGRKLRENTDLGREAKDLRISIEHDRRSKKASIRASQESLKNILLHDVIAAYIEERVKKYDSLSISDEKRSSLISEANLALTGFSGKRLLLGQKDIISEIHGSEARMSDYMMKMNEVILSRIERAGNTPFLTTLNDFASDMGLPIGSVGLILAVLGATAVIT